MKTISIVLILLLIVFGTCMYVADPFHIFVAKCSSNAQCDDGNPNTFDECTYFYNTCKHTSQCVIDSDCNDNDSSTEDVCIFRGGEVSSEGAPMPRANECMNEKGFYCAKDHSFDFEYHNYCVTCLGKKIRECTCSVNITTAKLDGTTCATDRTWWGLCKSGFCEYDPEMFALGNKEVNVIELYAKGTSPTDYFNKVENDYLPTTKKFLEDESKRYGISNFSVNFKIIGSYELVKDIQDYTVDDGEYYDGRSAREKVLAAIDDVLIANHLNASSYQQHVYPDYRRILYVYFDNSLTNLDDFLGDHGAPITDDGVTHSMVHISSFIADDTSTVTILLHELGHSFGATEGYMTPCDRGNYMSCCKLPQGIPQTTIPIQYPQEKACLMCLNIELTADGQGQAPTLGELVICQQEAYEMGWLQNAPY